MSVTSKNNLFSGDYLWDRFPGLYAKSVNLTRKLTEAYNAALSEYDVLVMPTTIGPADAFPLETDGPVARMSKMGLGKIDNTCPFNGSGHPALAMPIGFVEVGEAGRKVKVPTSLQIVGKYFDESLMLRIAYAWENARDWKEF
jgi:amidase